jgi:hypothetical protein
MLNTYPLEELASESSNIDVHLFTKVFVDLAHTPNKNWQC